MKRTIKTKSGEISIAEAFEEFLVDKEARNLSKSSLRDYSLAFKRFGDRVAYPSEIDSGVINHWVNSLKADDVAITTVNFYVRHMRTFFNWLFNMGYIQAKIDIKELRGQEEPPKFFSDEDLMALIEKPRPSDSFSEWRTWCMVQTVLATGVREGTIVEMKVSDFNFRDKTVLLAHTKNKKAQILNISAGLESALKEYMRRFDVGTYMFPNVGDEQLTTNAVRLAFKRYCHNRGVEQHNFHGLRHSFCKQWITNGGNPMALKTILGHSSMTMTSHYVNIFGNDIKDYESYSALDVLTKKSRRTSKFK